MTLQPSGAITMQEALHETSRPSAEHTSAIVSTHFPYPVQQVSPQLSALLGVEPGFLDLGVADGLEARGLFAGALLLDAAALFNAVNR